MKVFITGIAGFGGSHLAHYLLPKGVEILGISRRSSRENIEPIASQIQMVEGDICDEEKVKKVINEIKPDRIFHLAAETRQSVSRENPKQTFTTNVFGTINLFEAVRSAGIEPLIHLPGSSAEYGLVYEGENPIKETNPFRPVSPYGVSKVAQEMVGYQYFLNYRLKIVQTRTFNYTGPGEREDKVCSALAKQVAMIEKGRQEPFLYLGNLDSQRDFTDVRDVARGYWLALERGIPGEVYNICAGKAYSIKEVLDMLVGMSKENIKINQDPKRMRPSDVPVQMGDYSKFQAQTGWRPQIPLKQSLEDLLNYWRERL